MAAVVGLPLLGVGGLVAALLLAATFIAGAATPPPATTGSGCADAVEHDGDVAATLWRVAAATNAPDIATLALFEAAIVESGVRNLDHGDRDSLGVLQQRPSAGWGTPAQLTDPAYAARAFLLGPQAAGSAGANGEPGAIARAVDWSGTAGELAQAVQRSAFPDRYDEREAEALALIRKMSGSAGPVDCADEQIAVGVPLDVPVPAYSILRDESAHGDGWGGPSVNLLDPRMKASVARLETLMGTKLQVNSGYRTAGYQAQLCRRVVGPCAPPGQSMHQRGLAVDVANYAQALPHISQVGLCQPLPSNDAWHLSHVTGTEC